MPKPLTQPVNQTPPNATTTSHLEPPSKYYGQAADALAKRWETSGLPAAKAQLRAAENRAGHLLPSYMHQPATQAAPGLTPFTAVPRNPFDAESWRTWAKTNENPSWTSQQSLGESLRQSGHYANVPGGYEGAKARALAARDTYGANPALRPRWSAAALEQPQTQIWAPGKEAPSIPAPGGPGDRAASALDKALPREAFIPAAVRMDNAYLKMNVPEGDATLMAVPRSTVDAARQGKISPFMNSVKEHEMTHVLDAPGERRGRGADQLTTPYDDRSSTNPWHYYLNGAEARARLSELKRHYAKQTGTDITTPQEAEKAWNWFKNEGYKTAPSPMLKELDIPTYESHPDWPNIRQQFYNVLPMLLQNKPQTGSKMASEVTPQMTDRELFKVAFLKKCASAGLDLQQTEQLVDRLLAKKAAEGDDSGFFNDLWRTTKAVGSRGLSEVWDIGKSTAKSVAPWMVPLAVVGPFGLGLAGGAIAGEMVGGANEADPEEPKAVEKIQTYQQVAEALRNRDALHKKVQKAQMYRPGRRLMI